MVKGIIDKMAVARNTAQNWEKERGVGITLHLVVISERLLCAKSGHWGGITSLLTHHGRYFLYLSNNVCFLTEITIERNYSP